MIRGRNSVTGESSGTGKTAILLGIAYALDILPTAFSAKGLQRWSTDDALQVSLVLEHDGQNIRLERGKRTEVILGDGTVISGAKSYPEAIKKVFGGITCDVLSALTYRQQRSNGFFLSASPSEKVEFLGKILGLGNIEDAVVSSTETTKKLETELAVLTSQLEAKEQLLARLDSEVLPPLQNLQDLRDKASRLEAERDNAQEELEQAQKTLDGWIAAEKESKQVAIAEKNKELDTAKGFLKKITTEDSAKFSVHQSALSELQAKLRALDAQKNEAESSNRNIRELEKQLASVKSGTCFTCGQTLPTPDLAVKLQKKLDKLELIDVEPIIAQQKETQLKINEMKWVPNPSIKKLQDVVFKLSNDIGQLQETPVPNDLKKNVYSWQTLLATKTREYNTAFTALGLASRDHEYRAALEQRKHQERAELTKQVFKLKSDKQKTQETLHAEKDFSFAMGKNGFMSLITDDVLHEISFEANKILHSLANTLNVNVDFATQTEKGRKQIQTIVSILGNEVKLECGPSGGQRTSIEQAVDFGLLNVLSRRVRGNVPKWLLLDEVFDGQGKVTKETALEGLRVLGQDRLVLVIDHGSEFGESFSETLDIVFDGGVSTVSKG